MKDKINKLRNLLKRGEGNKTPSPPSIDRVNELFEKLSELPEELWSFNYDKLKGLDKLIEELQRLSKK